MGTTAQRAPTVTTIRPGGGSGGGVRPPGPDDGELKALSEPRSEPVRTGIWVGLAAIGMMFAAFTSALIVRQGSGEDWHHLVMPRIVLLNTLVLIASSLSLEGARRKVASYFRTGKKDRQEALRWLYATVALGGFFVAGQFVAWQQLRAQGLYLSTNPNSSFFYVLTAVHAVHVLGGLGGLLFVIRRLSAPVAALRRSSMDSTSYYWHFMGALWLYLLLVVWIKL